MVNRIKHYPVFLIIGLLSLLVLFNGSHAAAQTTTFTYQGKLMDNGTPATGSYDITFKLFDTATIGSGAQQGATVSITNVTVSAGIFTVQLDFGACANCFNGSARFLEIAVKPTSSGSFITLSPRQPIAATPYSIKSVSATTADGLSLSCVSCVTSSQIQSVNGSTVSGTIPVASVPAGSASYIQNTTSQQANTNFNISGNGIVGGNLGIGTSSPQHKLHVIGQAIRVESPDGNIAPRFSLNFTGGGTDQKKWQNYAAGTALVFSALNDEEFIENQWLRVNRNSGLSIDSIVLPSGNVGIGTNSPQTKLHVVGQNIRIETPSFTSFFPRFSLVYSSGATDNKKWQNYANPNGLVFSALNDAETQETAWLRVNRQSGTTNITSVEFPSGFVRINQLVSGAAASVCRDGLNQLAVCSSSVRYKKNVKDYKLGFDLIKKLRPVSFNWKADNKEDMGLIAEEVMAVEPLLATTNEKGEVEGVKYDRVGVVLVNVVKEQQAQIERQQSAIERQQKEIESLKRLICSTYPKASECHYAKRRRAM